MTFFMWYENLGMRGYFDMGERNIVEDVLYPSLYS